jgi:hypothetical protein
MLHRLAESIPWNLTGLFKRLRIRAQAGGKTIEPSRTPFYDFHVYASLYIYITRNSFDTVENKRNVIFLR